MERRRPEPSLWLSLLPCGLLAGLLMLNVAVFGDEASSGPNQVALLLCALFTAGLGHFALGLAYPDIEKKSLRSIGLAMQAMVILLIVGCLIGLWIISGIVPAMIYYGVQALHPRVFLLVACIICSVVSLAIGSSWSTSGTVGIALIGIGGAMGFPLPLVAGAIISGAYFGDKMSPLSETTNLAPAVAGSELFTHIRHMLYTTLPAYLLALAAFTATGFLYTPGDYSAQGVEEILRVMGTAFRLHWTLMLVPLAVIVLAARRMPAIPALVIGAILGAVAALIAQPHQFIDPATGAFSLQHAYHRILMTAYNGYAMQSGNEMVDTLLSRGGMANMFNTISVIMTAMLFGGSMEATGMLPRIATAILRAVRGAGSLICATEACSILFNIFAAEQYMAIVIPGRMFRPAYQRYKLDPRNLSRALEDAGTVTSVLVPWNTCGVFTASILGVATFAYLPFCFFNLLCPVISMSMAAFHLTLVSLPENLDQSDAAEAPIMPGGGNDQ